MRIQSQNQTFDTVTSSNTLDITLMKQSIIESQKSPDEDISISKDKLQQAIDSINEIFEINNSELKFIFHDGLKEYYVQLVDSETEEVVKEIPSKKLLDIFYEMQKLVGMIVDEKI